jgi:hypothetical protein
MARPVRRSVHDGGVRIDGLVAVERERLRRQLGSGDPFDAPRQLAIGFHEFLHSPPRQRKSRVWPHETGALTRKPAGLLIGHEEMSG